MDVNIIGNKMNTIQVQSTDAVNQYNNNSNLNKKIEETDNQKLQKIDNKTNEKNNQKNNEFDKKELDKALKKLNKFLEDERTRAEYSVHKDLGTIMIKVIDEDTKKVLLEVPPKKILDMVASMCKEFGLIDRKA